MLTAQWLETIGITPYTTQRVNVYTVGGTQIGLAGVYQGPDILSFPGSYVVGDALQSSHWVRLSTPEELSMDPVRKFQILSQQKGQRFLIFDTSEFAYEGQCFGFRGGTMTALAAAEYTPPPLYHVTLISLDAVNTPPCLRTGSEEDDTPVGLVFDSGEDRVI